MRHRGAGAFVGEERITARASGISPPIAAISLIFMDPAKREAMKAHIAPHYRWSTSRAAPPNNIPGWCWG
jgi:hypothetical protein